MTSHIGTGHFTKRSDFYRGGILENDLGERQQCSYLEGEAPAEPKPSSAGASLSH